jgi:WD40 repeat protein
VYSGDGEKILSASSDDTIKEWDAATGECAKTLTGHTKWVNSAMYGGDGKKILSASGDKTIKEWDATTGECVKTLKGHTSRVNSVVYSGDGKKILSASDDETIKEWDAATGECVKTLEEHINIVTSTLYSRDGKKILSASHDNTIKEWDAQSGQWLATYKGKTTYWPEAANKNRDSNILEVFINERRIKNKSTSTVIKTLVNIPGLWIQGCSFARLHPDCRLSEEEIQLLKMYGGRVTGEKREDRKIGSWEKDENGQGDG